jgi:type VI secretion system protein ImpB
LTVFTAKFQNPECRSPWTCTPGGAQKKVELPLKLLVAGDFSAGREQAPLAEREKVNIDKNNFDTVLADYAPDLKIAAENTLAGDAGDAQPVARPQK